MSQQRNHGIMEYKIGDIIDRNWEVKDVKLGGFGIVYICYSHLWNRLVALKTFQDKYFESDKVVEDFYKEAETWIKIGRHRNIVEAITLTGLRHYRPHIVMEYVDGGNLRDRLRSSGTSVRQTLNLGIQFCFGMIYANSVELGEGERGIVHRDIKSSNIMLTKDDILKITDFGLVRALGRPATENPAGTPEYMSPEQFRTMDVDQRSDIYSFGVVLYEMLSGSSPFYIQTENNKMRWEFCEYHHQEVPPRPLRQINPSISENLERVVLKCLEKKPEDRYENFEELEDELMGIYQAHVGRRPSEGRVMPMTSEAWVHRGIALFNLRKYNEMMVCFGRALEIDPKNADAWAELGKAFYYWGRLEDALRCIDKALEIDPKNSEKWSTKGGILKDLGKYEEAMRCFEKALEIDPSFAHAWTMMGETLLEQAISTMGFDVFWLLTEAIRCFDRSLEINPRSPLTWTHKGLALIEIGERNLSRVDEIHRAIECFDNALKYNPRFVAALVNKGTALADLGKHGEALKCYDRALQIYPKEVDAWYNKGNSLLEMGKYEEALECYDKALEINPRLRAALHNKAVTLRRLGRYRDAERCFEEGEP